MGTNDPGGGDSVASYIRHAERFGTELVFETFREEAVREFVRKHRELRATLPAPVNLTWLPFAERERILNEREVAFAVYHLAYDAAKRKCTEATEALARLRIELDAIDADRPTRRRYRPSPPRRRRSRVETIEAVRRLRAEGLVPSAIAAKLRLAEPTVKRYLASENGTANAHGYAANLVPRSETGSSVVRTVSVHERLVGAA